MIDVSASYRQPRRTASVSLNALFPHASFVGCGELRVSSVACDSRRIAPQALFAVIAGARRHGRRHVAEALARGAAALLVDTPLPEVPVPQCVVRNVRSAYARLCAALQGDPARALKIAGVTGTNGKTSVTWLLRSMLHVDGTRCGLAGTIEIDDAVQTIPASLTTPDPSDLQAWLRRILDHRGTHAIAEVSSHALDQSRLAGVPLDAAVITNITHDHFDYHTSRDNYVRAKAAIGELLAPAGVLVVNADDPGAGEAAAISGAPRQVTFGFAPSVDIRGRVIEESLSGSRFLAAFDGFEFEFQTPLIGRHQISNCLAAIAVARHWHLPVDAMRAGISRLKQIPGRLESIPNPRGLSIFVDYAHTPDALERSLSHLKRVVSGRLIVVFGAGGDRDPAKRPEMGRVACEADLVVLTNDNPRTEDPQAIIAAIRSGTTAAKNPVHCEPDRRAAIRWALAAASPGDAVLVAGKGHETFQVIGDQQIPFDDAAVIRDCLAAIGTGSSQRHPSAI